MKRSKVLSLALLAASLSAVLPSVASAAPACVTPKEASAYQVRQLQVDLMVATLKCRDIVPGMRASYNTFINKFGGSLNTNATTLKASFSKRYGGGQQREFDRYMTRLANDADIRSRSTDNYCGVKEQALVEVLAMQGPDMEAFAQRVMPVDPALTVCSASAAPEKKDSAKAPAKPATKPTEAAKAKPATPAKPNPELAKKEPEKKKTETTPAAKPADKPGDKG